MGGAAISFIHDWQLNEHHLLVGENQYWNVLELLRMQQLVQLSDGITQSFFIHRVDDIDKRIGGAVVMRPQFPQFLLSADIPNFEGFVFVFNFFNIKSDGWYG